jgi:hypothetical protein
MTAPTRAELIAHVAATRIAGDVATARASNLANIDKMLARDDDYWFGVELAHEWTAAEVLDVMARRVGIDPDPTRTTGTDRIDPERCVDALDEAAELIARTARDRGRVLLATGHPTGLLETYMTLARALAAAGCEIVTPLAERQVTVPPGLSRRIRYLGGVATIGTGGDLLHTHAPEPMLAILEAQPRPADLVVADHGWAGAAGARGLEVVGFADTNDPALFVAAEQKDVAVVVPLDDNVAPVHYEPLAAYLTRGWGEMSAPPDLG